MSRKSQGKVSKALEDALSAEVREVTRKYEAPDATPAAKKIGDFVYDTVERMRVYDRALKLEGLKLKVDDSGFGANFDN